MDYVIIMLILLLMGVSIFKLRKRTNCPLGCKECNGCTELQKVIIEIKREREKEREGVQ